MATVFQWEEDWEAAEEDEAMLKNMSAAAGTEPDALMERSRWQ
jgi:hypothetical protein